MKQITKVLAVALIGVLLAFGGCNKAKEAAQEVATAAKTEPEVLKVKDLYLGMNIEEVPAILKSLLAKHEISQVKVDKEYGHKYVVQIDNDGMGGSVFADGDKKVVVIYFALAIDDLFNSADMAANSYAEKFMSSYNIPSMEPVLGKAWWQYTSPDGFKISIHSKYKFTRIEKVASQDERKFN